MPSTRHIVHCQLVDSEWKGNGKYTISVRSGSPGATDIQKFVVKANNDRTENQCQRPLVHRSFPQGTTCQMGFSSSNQLSAHIKAVHDLDLFECQWQGCHKLNLDGSNNDKHERTCSMRPADRPARSYQCNRCGRVFHRSDNLRRHKNGCTVEPAPDRPQNTGLPTPPPSHGASPVAEDPAAALGAEIEEDDRLFPGMRGALLDFIHGDGGNAQPLAAPEMQQQLEMQQQQVTYHQQVIYQPLEMHQRQVMPTFAAEPVTEAVYQIDEPPLYDAAAPAPAPVAAPWGETGWTGGRLECVDPLLNGQLGPVDPSLNGQLDLDDPLLIPLTDAELDSWASKTLLTESHFGCRTCSRRSAALSMRLIIPTYPMRIWQLQSC